MLGNCLDVSFEAKLSCLLSEEKFPCLFQTSKTKQYNSTVWSRQTTRTNWLGCSVFNSLSHALRPPVALFLFSELTNLDLSIS